MLPCRIPSRCPEVTWETQRAVPVVSLRGPFNNQAALYDAIVESVAQKEGQVFFADGPGGSGKTFVEQALLPMCVVAER